MKLQAALDRLNAPLNEKEYETGPTVVVLTRLRDFFENTMKNNNTTILLTELFKEPSSTDIKEKLVLVNIEAVTHVSSGELIASQVIIGQTKSRPISVIGLVTGATIRVSENIEQIAEKIHNVVVQHGSVMG